MTEKGKKPDKEQQTHDEASGVHEDWPIIEVSLEELDEVTEEVHREMDAEELVDTQHSDGSTADPWQAQQQGLVYTPPSDPPVIPSDDPQGAEIAAGFASSMEEIDPDVEDLPPTVDNNDLDLQEGVYTALRDNSETGHLTHVRVGVNNGVVYLAGTVFSLDDIAIVEYLVRDLPGVVDVRNNLQVAESHP